MWWIHIAVYIIPALLTLNAEGAQQSTNAPAVPLPTTAHGPNGILLGDLFNELNYIYIIIILLFSIPY